MCIRDRDGTAQDRSMKYSSGIIPAFCIKLPLDNILVRTQLRRRS